MRKSLENLYKENEVEKKRPYGERVRNSGKEVFTSLVFTATGGMGNESSRKTKRLANLIVNKTGAQ